MTDTLESQVFDTISIRGVEKPFASLSSVSMLDSAQRQLLLASGTYLGREVPSGGLYMSDGGHVDMYSKTAGQPTISWTQGSTAPVSSSSWTNIAYGNDKFVVISDNRNAAYSANGSTWSSSSMLPSGNQWRSITFGDGKFVALNRDSNTVAYSTDGATWTSATLPGNGQDVTYGNGKFVVIGASNSSQAYYSTNGSSWSTATLPSSGYWKGITYGNGMFVAVASRDYSHKVAYSTNGTTWTVSSISGSALGYTGGVVYGNGVFLAFYSNYSQLIRSTNGTTWTDVTIPNSFQCTGIAHGNGIFVAVSRDSTYAYSTDGATWVVATKPFTDYSTCVAYGDNKFVSMYDSTKSSAIGSVTVPFIYSLTPVGYGKSETDAQLSTKQDTLTAGTNINIDANNVITATQTYDSATETIVF